MARRSGTELNLQIDPLGDSALLVRVRPRDPADDMIETMLASARALREAEIAGVIEIAPAYMTLGVFYDGARCSFEMMAERIEHALKTVATTTAPTRIVEIPVCYEREFGPDLDAVAQHTGLSVEEVIERHSAAEYRVSCVGFTPGFPYLSGLPNELSTPRRATPRKQVPAGSVAIGGSQTGVYPSVSPGGWHLIGRTRLRLFDPEADAPALLQAGDRVRFRAISPDDFDA
ncbi:MAG: 5-oxoprolinase subunit PxpB [Verrucomicrobiota bacterium]|nr:5-oxoprolinase subunit PxpB [Verrucomicrobiota bacterium]